MPRIASSHGPALRWALILALTAFISIFAAACGSDDGINDEPEPAAEKSEPVVIDTDGQKFDPATVYRETVPGVISVRSIFGESSNPLEGQAAGGSGFVLTDDGEIVTNAHVITNGEGEDRAPAKQVYVEFYDGNVVPAEIVGFDPFADVGLIKVDPEDVELTPLALADSEKVAVGQPIAVIGSPFGEDHSLSTGVVSQTGRSVMSLTDFQIDGAIQTDASINPGNSGGPMLDAQGRVIGISQQMKSGSGASNGVGFGVPANSIENSVEQLRENGEASYAYIGVSTQPVYPQLAEKLGIDVETGALVGEVVEGGPAEKAGIKGGEEEITFQANRYQVGGDVIISVNGEKIEHAEDLGRIIGGLRPGDSVELGIVRDGKEITVKVDLEERPTALTTPTAP
ncbi:MAG TPA: trypsin-like peptidase domain-containing protein [Solirubrobacterales bacterium]|nr:trypsin-like peptidase domain-containing protein [Solirubrobacterales bacterium]